MYRTITNKFTSIHVPESDVRRLVWRKDRALKNFRIAFQMAFVVFIFAVLMLGAFGKWIL